jgi:O-antigen/teichoic acid export membrane protein
MSTFRAVLARTNLSAIKLPFLLSLCNQLVSSGGNFLLGIYLARTLPLEDFGMYGLGYGICMLYIGVGNAVILTQMVVNMPDRTGAEREMYAARMFCAVALLGMTVLLVTGITYLLMLVAKPEYIQYRATVASVAAAAVLFLFNEFFISYAYIKRKESLALMVNLLTITALFTGVWIIKMSGLPLTASHVLLCYALGAAIASTFAFTQSLLPLAAGMKRLFPDLIESWKQGKWALGGAIVTWIQAQAYAYVLVVFLGPVGVGQANAARIFISPFSFLIPAVNKIAIPRLADLRNSDSARMSKASITLTLTLSAMTIVYSLIVMIGLDYMSQWILGRRDTQVESLVWAWCLVLIFQLLRTGGAILMQVQRKFRMLMLLNIPSAVVTMVAAILFIYWIGTAGAILGMVAGEVILAVLIWKEIRYGQQHQD